MLLSTRDSWKKLEKHAATRNAPSLLRSKEQLSQEEDACLITTQYISLDYSAQGVDEATRTLLCELATECRLSEGINALMSAYPVNQSENKPALHTALRAVGDTPLLVNGQDIVADVLAVREQMRLISDKLRAGEWLGFTGLTITDVVNIGVGGSHLGPQFCLDAFTDLITDSMQFHFLSGLDPSAFQRTTRRLNPETTLFIVASKSFTTQETINHTKRALTWIGTREPEALSRHFIAVTAHPDKAKVLGISEVCRIWDWVGGRYSACSAINLITSIAIGFDQFSEFLKGAHAMDEHFRKAPFSQNLPIILALLGIWNNNFLKIHTLLVLTYAQALHGLLPFLQQLDMESNGKSIDKEGRSVNYSTGPIIWGGLGDEAQHSYYQLLCQGTHRVAAELISSDVMSHELITHLARAHQSLLSQGTQEETNNASYIPGNTPVNHLRLVDCSPRTIGALIALYEHKVFVQGFIWNINSFDQPAVESSKRLMNSSVLREKSGPLTA